MGRRSRKKLTRSIARKVIPVNGSDKEWTKSRFVLWFSTGGYATPIYLLVWANHLEDALEEAHDWLLDNAPGIFSDDAVQEEYERLRAEGKSEEEAQEGAEVDETTFGHNGLHYIPSENWGIVKEDPSRRDLLELEGRPAEHRARGVDPLAKKARVARRRYGR